MKLISSLLLSLLNLSAIAANEVAFNSTKPNLRRNLNSNCGGGDVGNGICADPSLCCSQWGWCGSSAEHCEGSPPTGPTAAPVAPPPTEPIVATGDSRMVAFIGNWQACPTDEQIAQYTTIVVSFAVAYTWSGGPVCTPTCDIPDPVICGNAPQPELVAKWQAAGKKVLLSFGGALMGGSWLPAGNGCWENCFGREGKVVEQLTNHVVNLGLDGVDLDYEYYYEDNQKGSGFTKGLEAQIFIRDVTRGLRASLPSGSTITHAPMDADVIPGTAYYALMQEFAFTDIDYLLPQHYNGITKAHVDGLTGTGAGSMSGLTHYSTLVEEIYDGDATRVLYGFCISDCSGTGSNVNKGQAKTIMEDLSTYFPCNGGAFFWVSAHDTGASWSTHVNTAIQPNSGCSSGSTPTGPTTPAPTTLEATPLPTESPTELLTEAPTGAPTRTPTGAPIELLTEAPTGAPIESPNCVDDISFEVRGKQRNCEWVAQKKKRCKKFGENCPVTCGLCPTLSPTPAPSSTQAEIPTDVPNESPGCADEISFEAGGKQRNCDWVAKKKKKRCKKYSEHCPVTCDLCESEDESGDEEARCCEPNETRMKAFNGCTQWYWCHAGIVQDPINGPIPGYLFDENIQNWNFEDEVTCQPNSC